MRRFLRVLAALWLACQTVAVASPLTLFSDEFGIDQADCCPGVGTGQVCPMHHHAAGTTCRMESICAHHDAALLTIVAVGVLPSPAASIVSIATSESLGVTVPSARSRAVVPDLPPPRI